MIFFIMNFKPASIRKYPATNEGLLQALNENYGLNFSGTPRLQELTELMQAGMKEMEAEELPNGLPHRRALWGSITLESGAFFEGLREAYYDNQKPAIAG